jgi:hypothetical protein
MMRIEDRIRGGRDGWERKTCGRDMGTMDKVQLKWKEEVEGLDLGPGSTCDSTLAVRHDRRWHD